MSVRKRARTDISDSDDYLYGSAISMSSDDEPIKAEIKTETQTETQTEIKTASVPVPKKAKKKKKKKKTENQVETSRLKKERRAAKREALRKERKERKESLEEDFISLNEDRKESVNWQESTDKEEDDHPYHWLHLIPDHPLPVLTPTTILEREVECLLEYLEPQPVERILRDYVIHRIRESITHIYPGSRVEVFGSYTTNLYLPHSDLDLVVISPPSTRVNLRRIDRILHQNQISHATEVIGHASVPVIKFKEAMTGIKVDIILDSTSGIDASRFILAKIEQQPALRPLTLLIKYLLDLEGENEVFKGGLGGYAIVCLVLSFLQRHPKVAGGEIDPMKNLGVLLIDFFQLYGTLFNLNNVSIDVRGDGRYKESYHNQHRPVFSIMDPLDRNNDIGIKSFHGKRITDIFQRCFNHMTMRAMALEAELKENGRLVKAETSVDYSFLKGFFRVSSDLLSVRQVIEDVYSEGRWADQEAAVTFDWQGSTARALLCI